MTQRNSEDMQIDYPFGTYNAGAGDYLLRKKETGREEVYESGVKVGDIIHNGEVQNLIDEAIGSKPNPDIVPVPVHNRSSVVTSKKDTYQTGTISQTCDFSFDCSNVVVSWSNNYRRDSLTLAPTGNPVTIKASISITPDGGSETIYPLYFNGQRTKVLNSGGICFSDRFDGLILSTDLVKIYTYFDCGVGGFIPDGMRILGAGADYNGTDGWEMGVDKVDTGGISGAFSFKLSWGFTAVMALPASGYQTSALCVGDSIMSFGNRWCDTCGTDGNDGLNDGYAGVAFKDNSLPYTNISCPGETAEEFIGSISARSPYLLNHEYIVCLYGTNDIKNNRTIEEVKADTIAIWDFLKKYNLKILWTTITPYTTSTDNYFTEANQTPAATEAVRVAYNAWLKDEAVSVYGIHHLLDVNAVAESVTTAGVWRVFDTVYSGTAEATSTVGTIVDSSIPVNDGRWNEDHYVVITGGTNFGQPPNRIGKNIGATLDLIDDYPVACDATTSYDIKPVSTLDGLHPRNKLVNEYTAQVVRDAITSGVFE